MVCVCLYKGVGVDRARKKMRSVFISPRVCNSVNERWVMVYLYICDVGRVTCDCLPVLRMCVCACIRRSGERDDE